MAINHMKVYILNSKVYSMKVLAKCTAMNILKSTSQPDIL